MSGAEKLRASLAPGGLARNTGFEALADLTFTAGRLLTFFVLGRTLGVTELGRYAALLALAQLFFPLSQAGLPHVAVRNSTRGSSFAVEWKKTLTAVSFGGTGFTVIAMILAGFVLDIDPLTASSVALSQLIGLSLQQAVGLQAAAQRKSHVGLAVNGTHTAARLTAVLVFAVTAPDYSVEIWSRYLVVGVALASIATLVLARRALGLTPGLSRPPGADLRAGFGFVFVQAASTAQADIDKVVLGGYGLDADVGAYSAAARMTDVASVPLSALVRASYAEFFRRGSDQISHALPFAKRLTTVAVGYGIAAGVALWITAPLLPVVMGDDFAESVGALRWMAVLPAMKAAQYFPANVLTGADRQWTRATLMATSALVNLMMNLYLAPRYGLEGAIAATLTAEVIFMVILWWAVRRAVEREGLPR